MKVLSKKTVSEMGHKELQKYCIDLEKALVKKGWYKKNGEGTLSEKEQETFNRIMDLFKWIRINAD